MCMCTHARMYSNFNVTERGSKDLIITVFKNFVHVWTCICSRTNVRGFVCLQVTGGWSACGLMGRAGELSRKELPTHLT